MADEPYLNVPDCRELLRAPFFLENAENKSVPLNNEKEVEIAWVLATPDSFSQLESYLQEYTWPENDEKKRYVEDPVVGGVVLSGMWRQAFVSRMERQKSRDRDDVEMLIVLTVRRGWAEELNWDEARITKGHDALSNTEDAGTNYGSDDKTREYDVEFPGISPYASVSVMNSLPSTKSDFSVSGNADSGTYHKQMVDIAERDDGSHSIIVKYSKPQYTLNGFGSWGLANQALVKMCWGVPKDLAQTVITTMHQRGYSVEPSFSKNDELVNLRIIMPSFIEQYLVDSISSNTCDRFWYSSMYNGIYYPYLYTIPSVATAGVQYDRDIRFNSQGSYDIIVRKGVRQKRDYDWQDEAVSTLEKDSKYQQFGVTDQATFDISNPPRGAIYEQRINIQADCSKDIDTSKRLGIYAATDLLKSRSSSLAEEHEQTFTNMDGQPALLSDAKPGAIYSTQTSINRFGYYDGRKNAFVAVSSESVHSTSKTGSESSDDTSYRNKTSPIVAEDRDVGIVTDANSTMNEFGYYDGNSRVTTAAMMYALSLASERSALQEEDADIYVNSPIPLEASTVSAGTISSARSTLNRFNYYDGNISTLDAVYAETGYHTTRQEPTQTASENRLLNSSKVLIAPTVSAGTIAEAVSTMNRFGYYDGAYVYREAIHVNATGTSNRTAFDTQDTETHVNSPVVLEAPARERGMVSSASSSLNQFAYYDGRIGTGYAIYANTGLRKTGSTLTEEDFTDRFTNAYEPLTVPSAEAGMQFSASNTLNQFGYYDGAYAYRTVNPNLVNPVEFVSFQNYMRTTTDNLYREHPVVLTAPDDTQGTIYSASNSITPLGYYNGTIRADASTAREHEFTMANTALFYVDRIGYVNHRGYITAPESIQGVIYSAQSTLNNDQTYSGALDTTTSIAKLLYLPFYSRGEISGLYTFKNRRTAPSDLLAEFDKYASNDTSVSFEPDCTYTGTARTVSVPGGSWSEMDTSRDWSMTKHRRIGGSDQSRTWSFTRHVDFGISANEALSSVSSPEGAPRLSSAGHGGWMCEWDELISSGTWA